MMSDVHPLDDIDHLFTQGRLLEAAANQRVQLFPIADSRHARRVRHIIVDRERQADRERMTPKCLLVLAPTQS